MTITRIAESHAEASNREVLVLGPSGPSRSLVQANTGLYSWRFASNTDPILLPAYDATALRTSMYMYYDSDNWTADVSLIAFKESLTANLAVEARIMNDERTIRLYVDGSLKDEDTWANIGIIHASWQKFSLVSSSTQNYASLYLNDTKILTYSGAITRAPWDLSFFIKSLSASNGVPTYTYVDDIYIDSMTTDADALPPAYRYLPSYAESAGDHADFTPLSVINWQMVDDGAFDDGDTTYNFVISSGAAPKDSFETSDITLPLDFTIVSAIPWCVCRKLNAASDARIILTTYDGVPPTKESTPAQMTHLDYFYHRARFETDADGDPWSEASFNADQFGYKAGGAF